MNRFVWILEGIGVPYVAGTGTHSQDAFTRMSPRDRQLITIFCVRCVPGHQHWSRA